MRPFLKHALSLVVSIFTVLFIGLRLYGSDIGYNISSLISDLGGLSYLYSTVGTMFAVFAGFVIVSESQSWNTLNSAANEEVRSLSEFLTWSKRLSVELRTKVSAQAAQYLEVVINEEWRELAAGTLITRGESILVKFHELLIAATNEDSEIGSQMVKNFDDLLSHRNTRIELSWQPLPTILKFTLVLVDAGVVCLSFFIGVRSIWLDYVFLVCIVALAAVVLLVVNDLDNPLRPGDWFLTSERYVRLLNTINR